MATEATLCKKIKYVNLHNNEIVRVNNYGDVQSLK